MILLVGMLFGTNLDLYAMVLATMAYSFMMCLFNSMAVKKYLGYKQEVRKTFVIPAVSALIKGVSCYVFYQGIYLILQMIFGAFIPGRVLVLVGLMGAILFAVVVYFVLELKLKGVTEEDLVEFPKGTALLRYAKRFHLIES